MTTILFVLTLLSLTAAGIFAVAAWRARAEAAARSATRVAALASALGAEPEPGSGIGDPRSRDAEFDRIPDPGSRIPDPGFRIPHSTMFASATTETRVLTTPAIATAIGAALLLGGGTVLRHDSHAASPRDAGSALELVSMRHARDGRALTVTGLVRNPSDAAPLAQVDALVFAFDRGGEFVASGEATVGARHAAPLQPGEEAPFNVTINDLADVGRYRVSFRTSAGPLRHVDRRAGRRIRAQ